MSIEGRINVDVLFHDKDGTASLKVVSLQDSKAYTTGKVAVVSGTVGTSQITIQTQPTTYRDSSGALVSFDFVERIVMQAAGSAPVKLSVSDNFTGFDSLTSKSGVIAALSVAATEQDSLAIAAHGGTNSYTAIIYGT
jgi:hypothetical protein